MTVDSLRAGPAVYNSVGPGVGGFYADPAASGPIGWDDYDTNSGVNLTAVKFVGGVTRAGGIMWFSFFNAGGGFVTNFGMQFPVGGNYIWTITFSSPPFVIPHSGLMQVYATDGAYGYPAVKGQWFMTTPDAVTVGSNNPAVGGGAPDLVNCFSFHGEPPQPGACCLADGTCQVVLTAMDCANTGGVFQGPGSDCNHPTPCAVGACCSSWQGCAELTAARCNGLGWDFRGVGTRCPTDNVQTAVHQGQQVVHWSEPGINCHEISRGVRGPDCMPHPEGIKIDAWTTTTGGQTCHQFGVPGSPALPADFFEPGSDPFAGTVCFVGAPLGDTPWGVYDVADTLILRTEDPWGRCALPGPLEQSVAIQIVALNLRSTVPIAVTGPSGVTYWDTAVDLSAIPSPLGSITALKSHCNGGTYTSELPIQPRFTFTRVDDPQQVRVLDTGLEQWAPVVISQTDNPPWVNDTDLAVDSPWCTEFHPNIVGPEPITACDCNGNVIRDLCDMTAGTSSDCNSNAVPDECDPCGDNNDDGAADLVDLATLVSCLTGPGGSASASCRCLLDAEGDGDLDLADFAAFQQCMGALPRGACCLPDPRCQDDMTPSECAGPGGTYQGDGTTCAEVGCPGCIPPGQDCWATECGGTRANFAQNPIPADFFDSGSAPFGSIIELGGGAGVVDTVVERREQMCFPPPLPATAQVPLELVELDLVSCQPIYVAGSGDWDVQVSLSGPQPTGTLASTRTSPTGGTFTAVFYVQPVYTFTRVAPPNDTRVFDTAAQGIPPITMQTLTPSPWSTDESLELCTLDGFAAGVSAAGERQQPCCPQTCHQVSGDLTPCDPAGGHCHCTIPPYCPECGGLTLLAARSWKTHGVPPTAEEFPIDLPLVSSETTSPGVETRVGGVTKLEFQFSAAPPVDATGYLKRADGAIYHPTGVIIPGNSLFLTFSGISNAFRYVCCLNVANLGGDRDVEVIGQVGNVAQFPPTTTWTTDPEDSAAIVPFLGQTATQANCKYDITQTPPTSRKRIDDWDRIVIDGSYSGPVQSSPVSCP